jgi:hypothetical protein
MFDEEFGIELDPFDPAGVFLAELPYGKRGQVAQKWAAVAAQEVVQLGPRQYWQKVITAVEKRLGQEFPPLHKDRTRLTVLERYVQGGVCPLGATDQEIDQEAGRQVALYLYDVVARNCRNVIWPNRKWR